MPNALEIINDALYRAQDGDPIFFVRYVPEVALTKGELLYKLSPAPLPVSPEPPAPPPPPPIDTTEEMDVAWTTLRVRSGPSVAASQIGLLYLKQAVRIDGSIASGDYHWTRLLSVNGVKFADVGYVAREGLIARPT